MQASNTTSIPAGVAMVQNNYSHSEVPREQTGNVDGAPKATDIVNNIAPSQA